MSGYGFDWVSKNDPAKKDISIDGRELYWNRVTKGWPLSIEGKQVIEEAGCIHTIQGYDLNYCGVIFAPEIDYINGHLIIDRSKYYDAKGKISADDEQLKEYILNIYATLLTRGIKGTFVYAYNKGLREYLKKYIKEYKEY